MNHDEVVKNLVFAEDCIKAANLDQLYRKIAFKLILSRKLGIEVPHSSLQASTALPVMAGDINNLQDNNLIDKLARALNLEQEIIERTYDIQQKGEEVSVEMALSPSNLSKKDSDFTRQVGILLATARQILELDSEGTHVDLIRTEVERLGRYNRKNFMAYIRGIDTYRAHVNSAKRIKTNVSSNEATAQLIEQVVVG